MAGPTLGSLATNFGLAPLVGKSVAVVSDARLSGRTDTAVITERLLSISREDALTVDRKHRDPVTVRLPTRFVILSNELPRLGDASGALAGRLIVLRFTRSWYGRADPHLSDRLRGELPGILLWAVEGWRRRERGRFVQPASGAGLVADMEDLLSPVGALVRERCRVGPGLRVEVGDLYRSDARGATHTGGGSRGRKRCSAATCGPRCPESTAPARGRRTDARTCTPTSSCACFPTPNRARVESRVGGLNTSRKMAKCSAT